LTADTAKCNLKSQVLNTFGIYSNRVIRHRKWWSAEPEVDRARKRNTTYRSCEARLKSNCSNEISALNSSRCSALYT